MWYQPIECDNTVKKPLVCDFSDIEKYGFEEDDFLEGREVNNWCKNVIFRATQKKYDGTPDDVLQNGYMIPIFSLKLREKLDINGIKGIQYLPIKVIDYNGKEYSDYFIANFLNCIAAFDFEKSIYNRFDDNFPNPNVRGQIAGVRKFVLHKSKITNIDIFRLSEYNQRFFVSDKFIKIFECNKFTGYSFLKVDVS